MRISDWSSDVCSSDRIDRALADGEARLAAEEPEAGRDVPDFHVVQGVGNQEPADQDHEPQCDDLIDDGTNIGIVPVQSPGRCRCCAAGRFIRHVPPMAKITENRLSASAEKAQPGDALYRRRAASLHRLSGSATHTASRPWSTAGDRKSKRMDYSH